MLWLGLGNGKFLCMPLYTHQFKNERKIRRMMLCVLLPLSLETSYMDHEQTVLLGNSSMQYSSLFS